jgi:hypothetical protein
MARIRTRDQKGGKLLGQGVYGCAFTPPLECTTVAGHTTEQVGKVGKITSEEDALVEFESSNHLLKLKDSSKYFILVEQVCVPKPRSKQKESQLKECNPLEGEQLSSKLQVIMPLGGKPLLQVPRTVQSIHYFSLCQHLLEAGTLLLMGRTVHFDLHMMNILCDSPSKARLIDFGLSWSPDMLTDVNVSGLYRMFNPKIVQEPPEVALVNGLLDEEASKHTELLYATIQQQKPAIQLLFKVFGIQPAEQMKTLKEFVSRSKTFVAKDWYGFYSLYWSKMDAWALGVLCLALFADLSMDPAFEESESYKANGQSALNTIKGLCAMDPGARLDAAEALERWAPSSEVLQAPDVQGWLFRQKQIRQQLEKPN